MQPASIAAQIAPLLTLLQEQICVVSGSAATPLAGGFSSTSGDISDSLRFRLRRFLRKCVVVAAALFELLFLLKRTARAHSALAMTMPPSTVRPCCVGPAPLIRKPAATAPTLPPAPTMPATPPSALAIDERHEA